MTRRIFITGTDTGAGKTYFTNLLIRALLDAGVKARAIKPVAAGIDSDDLNEDVSLLMQAQGLDDPAAINLYSFAMPASPNLAAAAEAATISPARLVEWCDEQSSDVETILIEGVGGLMVPLTDDYLVCNWLNDISACEVILVVGARLGCISHTLLTLDKLEQMGRPPTAVVINDLGNKQAAEQAELALRPHIDTKTIMLRLPNQTGVIHDLNKDILAQLNLLAHSV